MQVQPKEAWLAPRESQDVWANSKMAEELGSKYDQYGNTSMKLF